MIRKYFGIFQQILNKSDLLLIIGYSFNDPHVNSIIGNAVLNHNLQLRIISPFSFRETFTRGGQYKGRETIFYKDNKDELKKTTFQKILEKGFKNYFRYTLKDIFPKTGTIPIPDKSTILKKIENQIYS